MTAAAPGLGIFSAIHLPGLRGDRVRRALACLLVAAFAALLLFNRLGDMRAPVWDEAYYLPTTARYQEGRAQFATHPPLGLLLIAIGDRIHGGNAGVDQRGVAAVKSIRAEAMPAGYDYLGPRLAPAFFGVVGAALFFLLMLELTGSIGAGLMLSTLYLCDAALAGQFRAAHLDPFQIAFTLAALLCAVRGLKAPSALAVAGFAFFVACAALVRVNGIMLAPMGLFLLWPLLRARRWMEAGRMGSVAGGSVASAVVLVFIANALVASALPDPATAAGRKDMAFLSPDIVAAGKIDATDPVVMTHLAGDYVRFIAADHAGMARSDSNASHPWQWIAGLGAITYRWDATDTRIATIALVPNRAAWMLSFAGVLLGLGSLRRGATTQTAMLLTGWFATMAALVALDGQRVLYAYVYFPSLMIGYALAASAWRSAGLNEGIARAGMIAVTLAFLASAPLAFHWEVPKSYCRMLLRDCGG